MLLALNVNSIRTLVKPTGRAKPRMTLDEVPRFAAEELGLRGLYLPTDLLVGATRSLLETLRDRGDKAGCACVTLIESDALPIGEAQDDKAAPGIDRAARVIEAAALLGCSSAAVAIRCADNDTASARLVERLKPIVTRAEKREINLLLMPTTGLLASPEKVTEIIKAVGGFRIGVLPDFQAAAGSEDPALYLKRLTPYASAVSASTLGFEEVEPAAPARTERAEAKQGKAAAGAGGKAGKEAASEPAKDPEKAAAKGDEETDTEESLSLDDLLDELEAELAEEDEAPPPVHVGFDLAAMVRAVVAVGYDQTLGIDYRGPGDGTLGVQQSRDALAAAVAAAHQGI
jgi:sugar phosphate isomerase/epimerase